MDLNTKVLKFVAASSVFGKRANDRLHDYQQKEAAAAPQIAPTLALMQRIGLVPASCVKEASSLLNTHAGTLELLRDTSEKLAEVARLGQQKAASDLGSGFDQDGSAGRLENSKPSPFIGRITSEKKASDRALEAVLLAPPGR